MRHQEETAFGDEWELKSSSKNESCIFINPQECIAKCMHVSQRPVAPVLDTVNRTLSTGSTRPASTVSWSGNPTTTLKCDQCNSSVMRASRAALNHHPLGHSYHSLHHCHVVCLNTEEVTWRPGRQPAPGEPQQAPEPAQHTQGQLSFAHCQMSTRS